MFCWNFSRKDKFELKLNITGTMTNSTLHGFRSNQVGIHVNLPGLEFGDSPMYAIFPKPNTETKTHVAHTS